MAIITKLRLVAVTLLGLMPLAMAAQSGVEAKLDADVISHYWWRGQDHGGVSVQPHLNVAWQGLSISLAGSIGFESKDAREVNTTLGYTLHGVNIGITDYWKTGIDASNRFFYFDEKKGAHRLEGNIGYSCQYFSLQAYTVFWGNDYKISGDKAYSTFIKLEVPFRLGGVDWLLTGGMTPFESAGYEEKVEKVSAVGRTYTATVPVYDYAGNTACVLASLRATKALDLGFSKLPVFAEVVTNPYMRKADFLFGFTITPF